MCLAINSAKSRIKMALQYAKLRKTKDLFLENILNSFDLIGSDKLKQKEYMGRGSRKRDIKEESKFRDSTEDQSE